MCKCKELQKLELKDKSEWAKKKLRLQQHKPNDSKDKYMFKMCDKKHNKLLPFKTKKTTQDKKNKQAQVQMIMKLENHQT